MNIKEIATTLAFLGTGSLAAMGCGKEQAPATEVPGGAEATPADAGEAKCAEGHSEEGHCGDDAAAEGEGSCSGESAEGEGSCSGEKAEGEGEGEGSCSGK